MDTQKIRRKEPKTVTTENHQITREGNMRGRWEQGDYKAVRKQTKWQYVYAYQ